MKKAGILLLSLLMVFGTAAAVTAGTQSTHEVSVSTPLILEKSAGGSSTSFDFGKSDYSGGGVITKEDALTLEVYGPGSKDLKAKLGSNAPSGAVVAAQANSNGFVNLTSSNKALNSYSGLHVSVPVDLRVDISGVDAGYNTTSWSRTITFSLI